MLPRDHFVTGFLYLITAGVKCCVAAVKRCPVLHFSVVIFSLSFRIIDASTIKYWQLSTAQAGPTGREGYIAHIHDPSCTDSIKPSLQFLHNFVVINASEGPLCFQIFFTSKLDYNWFSLSSSWWLNSLLLMGLLVCLMTQLGDGKRNLSLV
jgi:hypothetical protein